MRDGNRVDRRKPLFTAAGVTRALLLVMALPAIIVAAVVAGSVALLLSPLMLLPGVRRRGPLKSGPSPRSALAWQSDRRSSGG